MTRPDREWVWALWSSRVETYSAHELICLFSSEDVADQVRDALIGKPRDRAMLALTWEDDDDFPDLYVRPVAVH